MSEWTESELPAIELFKALGYEYQTFKDTGLQPVLMEGRLRSALFKINPWLDDIGVQKVIKALTVIDADSLIDANYQVHQLLAGAELSHQVDKNTPPQSIQLIDFANPENNDWLVVNQISYKGQSKTIIPDIMVYVNGLPVSMIEAKNPSKASAIDEAINDLAYYQQQNEKLFWPNVLNVGICGVDARYGAVKAPAMFYQKFKFEALQADSVNSQQTDQAWSFLKAFSKQQHGDDSLISQQDKVLYSLFEKNAFLDLLRNFAIFEMVEGKRIKKLPRYQQIRAVNKCITKVKDHNQGGVVWHTQGSGKSITMFYLAKKLRQPETGLDNPTVLILTDRTNLDNQISKTFKNLGLDRKQATSVNNLKTLINDDYGKVITTTIQKFDEDMRAEGFVDGDDAASKSISDKQNIFILIDEAHRTQYGDLAGYMRQAMPNAKYFAFTGTPIDKENKSTLSTFYGREYIDTYTIKQAVEDGATLPIFYDSALPKLHVEDYLDSQFDFYFKDATDEKKKLLKQHATSMKNIMVDPDRIRDIGKEIIQHYSAKIHPNGFKGMIVCFNREAAVNYKKTLDALKAKGVHGFNSKLVMSFQPKKDPQEYFDLAVPSNDIKDTVEDFTLPLSPKGHDEAELDKSGKKQFDDTHFLIVSDMLLTGFDAPVVQAMYLDKPLKEHTLLQTIARVNRTHKGKNGGFIIDFCGITNKLKEALEIFGGEVQPNEVMVNLASEIPLLENRHQKVLGFFKSIELDRLEQADAYKAKAVLYLKTEERRDNFNELMKRFNQSMDIVLPDPAGLKFRPDFKLFNEIKVMARNAYVEDTLKVTEEESAQLKELLHEHLRSQGVGYLFDQPVAVFEKAFQGQVDAIIDPELKAKTLTKRLSDTISEQYEKDPAFYKSLSESLDEMIQQMEDDWYQQATIFDDLMEMVDDITEHHQPGQANPEQQAIKGLLSMTYGVEDAPEVTSKVCEVLGQYTAISDWKSKDGVKKEMRKEIRPLLKDIVGKEKLKAVQNEILDVLENNS